MNVCFREANKTLCVSACVVSTPVECVESSIGLWCLLLISSTVITLDGSLFHLYVCYSIDLFCQVVLVCEHAHASTRKPTRTGFIGTVVEINEV